MRAIKQRAARTKCKLAHQRLIMLREISSLHPHTSLLFGIVAGQV